MTQLLTKEQILACDDIKVEVIQVPEWGGAVRVRQFSGNGRSHLMQNIDTKKKLTGAELTLPDLKLAVCALAIVGDDNKRLFSDAEIEILGEKSSAAIDRIYVAAEKLNALTEETSKEVEKN